MNMNRLGICLIALLLVLSCTGLAPAASVQDAVGICATKKGKAHSCCSLLLDDPDELQQCVSLLTQKQPSQPAKSTVTSRNSVPPPHKRSTSAPTESPVRETDQADSSRSTGERTFIYHIGGFPPHDMSHLLVSGWKKDEATSISSVNTVTKGYGIKSGDIKLFEKKLLDISAIIKEVPSLNPPRGCAPRLGRAIDDVYDIKDSFSKKQPIRGQILAGCFKLYERKVKRNGVSTTEWQPDHETRQYHISVNNLDDMLKGQNWTNGPSPIRPLEQFFTAPQQVGELQGFPIYARQVTPEGVPRSMFVLISRKGVQPFLPVGREQFIKALINTLEYEIKTTYYTSRNNLPDNIKNVRAMYQQQLISLRPEEKEMPACFLNRHHDSWGQGNVPLDTPDCKPIVRLNPDLINPKAPRTSVQFVMIRNFEDIQQRYNELPAASKDSLSNFRVTIDTITQTDWSKVYNLIGKP
ncbi:hypothetical protein SAMN02745119_03222 [Trichlorobacter thiogenes]|uniref:Uncharacterized protein n=1 Tax=Trichlorobacter thiogenes TaxID=115783 RepID=A0A1T4S390_9BACT|nr:hypothetical protein [Trichlorobacter thiogenes]SKA22695.1 hypothetical protein SAMN02745119_03222 [Trichlorobacter thiogenes]